MLDINIFLKAQKVLWVKRLLSPDKASWKAVPRLFLESQLGFNIFKCNMICTDKPAGFPGFYWQILQAWFETKNLTKLEETPINIRRECLWLNKNIKNNKKVLFWKEWHENGINIIHDIINENGNFLDFNEIYRKYGVKCNFIKYNRLKESIPQQWRKIIKIQRITRGDLSFSDPIFLKIKTTLKSIENVTNKDIYWIHIRKKQVKPIINDKLEYILGINEDEWENIFLVPKTVKNTKIRVFQYKVLFNLIPCNLYLKRIKKSDTDKCDQCSSLDDIFHYLCECDQIQTFWSRFGNWWKNMMGIDIQLDQIGSIFVGWLENMEGVDELNACILIAK
jgi:hypothetical protein